MNRYCGPSALSIITGMNTGEAARLIRHISGGALVKGTTTGEILRALTMCGLGTRRHPVPVEERVVERKGSWMRRGGTYIIKKGELTLAAWLKKTVSMRTSGRVFLVVAGTENNQHWQVISGRRFCCARTKEIVSITDKKVGRRARVLEVYEVLLFPGNKIKVPAVARKPKTSARTDPARRELEALLKKHGIPKGKIVPDGHIKDYVIPPCDHFEQGCSTIHYDWGETLGRIGCASRIRAIVLENEGHWSE
jgi:hypothetical protein